MNKLPKEREFIQGAIVPDENLESLQAQMHSPSKKILSLCKKYEDVLVLTKDHKLWGGHGYRISYLNSKSIVLTEKVVNGETNIPLPIKKIDKICTL